MIPLEEARALVRASIAPLAPCDTPVGDAVGLVVAETVLAREPSPSFTNSSMDGYALRALDSAAGPVTLRVVATVLAGDVPDVEIGPGEAARIMTGAPVPAGADSVCKVEETEVLENGRSVRIGRAITAGQFVRHPGDDVRPGQVLVAAGSALTAAHVGVLSGQGIASLSAHPRPRVGVLSTGDELITGPGPLAPGRIRDMNGPMLRALLIEAGAEAVDLGVARDDAGAVRERLEEAIRNCDAVVSTGGVSVGDVDFVKTAIAQICGDRARSMQVAMRPGKPFTFGSAPGDATPLFGLAGNPVSTLVGFEMFVRPAVHSLAGHRDVERARVAMVLDQPLMRERDGKVHLVHARARWGEDGRVHVTDVLREGSHRLHAVAEADVLVFVPDGQGVPAGSVVEGLLLCENLRADVGD